MANSRQRPGETNGDSTTPLTTPTLADYSFATFPTPAGTPRRGPARARTRRPHRGPEGTPGLYRKLAKTVAFKLGVLGDDSDVYGHLWRDQIASLLDSEFDVIEAGSVGSPLMPAIITESDLSKHLLPVYERTQVVTWWMLVVGTVG